jgi:hypothetical protein
MDVDMELPPDAAATPVPAPRSLAPGGPGATGCALIDCVLAHPDLCRLLLSFLAPRLVLGLRGSCTDGAAIVAAHGWDAPLPPPSHTASLVGTPLHTHGYAVRGAAALRRWLACFPAARCLVVEGGAGDDAVGDADVAAVGAACPRLERLALMHCARLSPAALRQCCVAALHLTHCPRLGGGGSWVHMGPRRLTQLSCVGCGRVDDEHAPALARATSLSLGAGSAGLSDAGLAALASARLVSLELTLPVELLLPWGGHGPRPADGSGGFDGAGLRRLTGLRSLTLRVGRDPDFPADGGGGDFDDDDDDGGGGGAVALQLRLRDDALAGCGRTLTDLSLAGNVDFANARALFSPLTALSRAVVCDAPDLTDAAVAALPLCLQRLAVRRCAGFVGGPALAGGAYPWLPPPQPPRAARRQRRLQVLAVSRCAAFTGEGLGGFAGGSLAVLRLAHCERVSPSALRGLLAGAGGPLPRLRSAHLVDLPELSDDAFAVAPAPAPAADDKAAGGADFTPPLPPPSQPLLEQLEVAGCPAFAGGDALPALPRLTALTVARCAAFTGAGLAGRTPALAALTLDGCAALDAAALAALLVGAPCLREARLARLGLTDAVFTGGGADGGGGGNAPTTAASCGLLTRLTVTACHGFKLDAPADAEGGARLRARLPALASLAVADCAGFTGSGLPWLPGLARLQLDGTRRLALPALPGCLSLEGVAFAMHGNHTRPDDAAAVLAGCGWDVARCGVQGWAAARRPWEARLGAVAAGVAATAAAAAAAATAAAATAPQPPRWTPAHEGKAARAAKLRWWGEKRRRAAQGKAVAKG